jgi:prepilin-type processing-associated H-X9-DG protein
MKTKRKAFSTVEMLSVIVIVAIVLAILMPVILYTRNSTRKTSCLSNLRQLGLSCQLYAQDHDDSTPGVSEFRAGRVTFPLGFGWAGKIFPYVKSPDIFRCSADNTSVDTALAPPNAQIVSYGLNDNLVSINLSQAVSASKTVMFFEVSGAYASISLPDEGVLSRKGTYTKFSPAGNGIKGSLIDSAIPWPGPEQGITTRYATGILDNSANDVFADDFGGPDGRHSKGANYLAPDGHSVWVLPSSVSAGSSAPSPSTAQSPTGCGMLEGPSAKNLPCAEGTAVGKHKLTFSQQ